jgi:3-hydroxyacyl-[acyl-carrier-protein] dehydratase
MTISDAIAQLYTPIENGGRFVLPEDFPAFNGHFPGQPVLPAVTQIMMAAHILSAGSGGKRVLKEIKKAKFSTVIRPGDTIDIIITPKAESYDIVIKNGSAASSTFQITME